MDFAGFDVDAIQSIREQFPALLHFRDGSPAIYLDNPAGTQVPRQVIDAVSNYYREHNANYGGQFRTSRETVASTERSRAMMAEFLGAGGPGEIMFGSSMTAITFQVADMIGELLRPGDEILLTEMDHDGNVTPWLRLAKRHGLKVKWLPFDPESARYRLDLLDSLLSDRTRIAAINYASNITGTINDVALISQRLKQHDTLIYVDAVQYAPHGHIDVQALGCDFLVCSAYKFYGPHLGVLWANPAVLETLTPARLQAAPAHWPQAFERGCLSSETIAGLQGALEYYRQLAFSHDAGVAAPYAYAKQLMHGHEAMLTERLIDGLSAIEGVHILGICDPEAFDERVSTVSIHVPGQDPMKLARHLGDHEIYVWNGHNYALKVIETYDLEAAGGVLRIGPVHYNTTTEIERTLEVLETAITSGVARWT